MFFVFVITWSIIVVASFVSLGLERSGSAAEAVDVLAQLNEKYGADYDGPESPKISLLICDPSEAWILDFAGKHWAAEKISGECPFRNRIK